MLCDICCDSVYLLIIADRRISGQCELHKPSLVFDDCDAEAVGTAAAALYPTAHPNCSRSTPMAPARWIDRGTNRRHGNKWSVFSSLVTSIFSELPTEYAFEPISNFDRQSQSYRGFELEHTILETPRKELDGGAGCQPGTVAKSFAQMDSLLITIGVRCD